MSEETSQNFLRAFPVMGLSIRTDRVELRLPTDKEIDTLAHKNISEVLTPDTQHFFRHTWNTLPSPELERQFIQHNWHTRASWQPDDWTLGMFVFLDNDPIGVIDITGREFSRSRTVVSGSWILPEYRGKGLGREIRAAIIGFAFSKLEAAECRSAADPDNVPSNKVSLSLGYVQDGTESVFGPSDGNRYLLTRANWKDDVEIQVAGFEECKDMFFG